MSSQAVRVGKREHGKVGRFLGMMRDAVLQPPDDGRVFYRANPRQYMVQVLIQITGRRVDASKCTRESSFPEAFSSTQVPTAAPRPPPSLPSCADPSALRWAPTACRSTPKSSGMNARTRRR